MNLPLITLLQSLGPDRWYLLGVMHGMGLSPMPNLVTSDAKSIANAAKIGVKQVGNHLDGLKMMQYVGMVNTRAWYLTDAGKQIGSAAETAILAVSAPTQPALQKPETAKMTVSAIEEEDSLNLKSMAEKFEQALTKCGVFSRPAAARAREIAADPTYWISAIMHIAFANSSECRERKFSYLLTVLDAANRRPGPVAYTPPEGLTISQMLDWAAIGETTADYYARTAPVVQLPIPAVAEPIAEQNQPAARPTPPVWQAAQAILKTEMPAHTYRQWVAPTGLEPMGDGAYLVLCPSAATREWLGRQLAPAIRRALASVTGAPVTELEFVEA